MHDACTIHMHSSIDEAEVFVCYQRKASALSACKPYIMESNSYVFDAKSGALFKEVDKLLDVR